jgi:hypothetical protein
MRKVIQIACAAHEGFGIVALCDDGTLWKNDRPSSCDTLDWVRVAPIPQPRRLKCTTTIDDTRRAESDGTK